VGEGQAEGEPGGNDWVVRQDPYVERLRPDPAGPAERVTVLRGLLGDSDREGYKRLYFTRDLDHYAEFRSEEVLFSERIPAHEPPFIGLDATSLSIRRNATVEYTWVRIPQPLDEFDLDIRLSPGAGLSGVHPLTVGTTQLCEPQVTQDCNTRVGQTCHYGNTCQGYTCDNGNTCETCMTRCQTHCGEATCVTCPTQCPTHCGTCATQCDPQCIVNKPTEQEKCIPAPTYACITRNCF
jgi:hypothetical protein